MASLISSFYLSLSLPLLRHFLVCPALPPSSPTLPSSWPISLSTAASTTLALDQSNTLYSGENANALRLQNPASKVDIKLLPATKTINPKLSPSVWYYSVYPQFPQWAVLSDRAENSRWFGHPHLLVRKLFSKYQLDNWLLSLCNITFKTLSPKLARTSGDIEYVWVAWVLLPSVPWTL